MTFSSKRVDLDEVLMNFRLCGRYHLINIILVFFTYVFSVCISYNYIFAAEAVSYRCKIPDTTCNDTNCSQTDDENSCHEWEYDEPDSFVAEFNLAGQEWKRTLVGSVHSFGFMIGLLIIGPLSDRIGRKAMIVFTGVIGAALGIAKSFVTRYWLYIALEFLEAAIGDIISPAYTMAVELVATKKRVLFIMFAALGTPIGYTVTPLVGWSCSYWRTYLRVLYTPGLLFALYYLFLRSDNPRWLLAKGKLDEAKTEIKRAAKMDKIIIDDTTLERLTFVNEKTASILELLKITFASHIMLKRFFICVIWWITSTFVNYGLVINSVSLQGNKYINFAIMGAIRLLGVLMLMFILKKYKRKYSLMTCFFIGAILCLAQPFVPDNIPWLSVTLYMAGKLMGGLFMDITYMYTSELFPTYTRNSMHALCSSLGRIGSIAGPQTPLLMLYWTGLPAIIFGSMALLAGILTILVPDTGNNSLPDDVKQAEALGSNKTKPEDLETK